MNKLFLTLLCVVSLTIVGCSQKGNTPEDTKQTPTKVDFAVKYYLNDSALQYIRVAIVDSMNLELGELPYTTASLDTAGTDSTFWKESLGGFYHAKSSLYDSIPVASIKVLTCTRTVEAGNYNYSIRFERDTTVAVHSDFVAVLTGMYSKTTYKQYGTQSIVNIKKHLEMANLMDYLKKAQPVLKMNYSF